MHRRAVQQPGKVKQRSGSHRRALWRKWPQGQVFRAGWAWAVHSHLPTLLLHQQPWPPKPRRGKSPVWFSNAPSLPLFCLCVNVCRHIPTDAFRWCKPAPLPKSRALLLPGALLPAPAPPPAPVPAWCRWDTGRGRKEPELNWGERKKLMIGWTSSLMQLTLWPHRCLGRGWLGGKMAFFAGSTDLWWVYLMQKLQATWERQRKQWPGPVHRLSLSSTWMRMILFFSLKPDIVGSLPFWLCGFQYSL